MYLIEIVESGDHFHKAPVHLLLLCIQSVHPEHDQVFCGYVGVGALASGVAARIMIVSTVRASFALVVAGRSASVAAAATAAFRPSW